MCQENSKQSCCENPEKLKGRPEDCSKEQIEKCHGKTAQHPCERGESETGKE